VTSPLRLHEACGVAIRQNAAAAAAAAASDLVISTSEP